MQLEVRWCACPPKRVGDGRFLGARDRAKQTLAKAPARDDRQAIVDANPFGLAYWALEVGWALVFGLARLTEPLPPIREKAHLIGLIDDLLGGERNPFRH